METNTSITLYHKSDKPDQKTRLDKWIRYPIKNVMWQGGKGASLNKGYERANDISIWIPYDQNEDLDTIPFAIGDIIVQGIIDNQITKQSDLKIDNYNITTFLPNKYGSDDMQHIFIGAK